MFYRCTTCNAAIQSNESVDCPQCGSKGFVRAERNRLFKEEIYRAGNPGNQKWELNADKTKFVPLD